MSTSDDDQRRPGRQSDTDSGAPRSIAIPGYRPAASDGPRHRPPSIQRGPEGRATGSQAAVRATGAHRAVRATGSQSAVRASGAHRAVRATGSQSAVRPPNAATSGARPSGRHAAVRGGPRSAGPAEVRPTDSSVEPRPRTAPGDAQPVAARAEPRGIDELQAEMAQNDIRLMARQIAAGERSTPPGPARRSERAAPGAASGSLAGLEEWRAYVAGGLIAAALVIGAWPVFALSSARARHARLAAAVQQAAQATGAAAAPGAVAGWIGDRDLPALKAFYTAQRPRIIENLAQAGFDELGPGDVSIRVDYNAATLVIGVQVEGGAEGSLIAAANLSGALVGRPPAAAGLGPAFAEQGGLLGVLLTGAGLIAGALWAVPAIVGRRKKG